MISETGLDSAPDPDVTERMARFTRSRDPRVLWPGLTDSALAAARADIEGVVRSVLADARTVALDAAGEAGVYALRIAAFTTGTGALLARWIEDGRVQSGAAVRNILARVLDQGRLRAARIERGVLPAFDALLGRGITPVVIKGFHTSRAYCEEVGVRPLADVDVLVQPDRVDDAETALREAGFRPTSQPRKPYHRHWRASDVDPRVFSVEGIDARSPWEIDLNASLDRPFATVNAHLDSQRHQVGPFALAQRSLLAPVQPLLLQVLAFQISQDLKSLRLMRLIDLVRVIRTDTARGTLDWDAVLAAFRREGTARFTYPALTLAEDLAPGTIDPRVLAAAHDAASPAIRRAVRGLGPAGASSDRTSIAIWLMWADGPIGALKIVLRVVADIVKDGPRSILTVSRALLRRIASGTFSFGTLDERHDVAKPPPRPKAAPTPRDGRGTPR